MSVLENRQPKTAPAVPAGTRPPDTRLDSWKAIAAYLGRGVRTVQRWEREEGLPVNRLAHEKRGSVYADRNEIDAWWESRKRTLSTTAPAQASAPAAPPSTPVVPAAPERITWMSAATFWPALSSDGRLLAYVSDGGRDGSSSQIWLHQIGGSAVCLTRGVAERSHLAFSADDTRIVFTSSDDTGQSVFAIPTLGGEPRILKRGARAGRPSPDGKWLAYLTNDQQGGVRIAALDGTDLKAEREIAASLIDVTFAIWSPDSSHVLVLAHPDSATDADYWVVSIDGSTVMNTGIVQRLKERGAWPIAFPATWSGGALVFSAITSTGVAMWRQRIEAGTFRPAAEPERLSRGSEFDWFPTAAAGRVAYVSTHTDQNIWSIAIEAGTGTTRGPLRRLTRGPGFVGHLSVTGDARTLVYFFGRPGVLGMMRRDLETDAEAELTPELRLEYGYPAVSPSGAQVACGARVPGPRALRPIFLVSVADGSTRKLGDDFGARPRQWIDERYVVVERFGGRLNSVGVVDTTTGVATDLLAGAERSITHPRVSGDGKWIAFDATRPGGSPAVFVAPMHRETPIREDEWVPVSQAASNAFWSADGAFLYYLPTTPSTEFRNVVRGRRFDVGGTGFTLGAPFTAFSSPEMVMPAQTNAITPVATRDRMIFVLGDFRGDVWMMDVSR